MVFEYRSLILGHNGIGELWREKPLKLADVLQLLDLRGDTLLQIFVPRFQLLRLLHEFRDVRINGRGASILSLTFGSFGSWYRAIRSVTHSST